jgi:hypothetical protein
MCFKFISLIIISSLLCLQAEVGDQKVLTKDKKPKRFYTMLYGNFFSASSAGGAIAGPGAGLEFGYITNSTQSVSAGFSTILSAIGGTSAVIMLDVRYNWALTGRMLREDNNTVLEGQNVLIQNDNAASGFRLGLAGSEYIFNGTTNAAPFSGIGIIPYYEMVRIDGKSYVMGVRYDQLVSGTVTITPLTLFFGLSFAL